MRPKVSAPKPTALETAAQQGAERERLDAVREAATRRTDELMRLFGPVGQPRGSTGGFANLFRLMGKT